MVATQSVPAVNPPGLSGVRFLVTKRIDDLDAGAARLESRLADARERRDELRNGLEDSEVRWGHMLKNLPGFAPEDVDKAFRVLSSTRADLATVEERLRDVGVRLTDLRGEQEMLRSVDRSLGDAAAATPAVATGSTRLRTASRQVFQSIEEERMRIARDMHDGPAQSMANLVLQAEILERLMTRDPALVVAELADFKENVRGILDETRRLIFDLRPMTLDDLGLVPTLRKFVSEFGERTGIDSHLRVVGEEKRLPLSLEPTLFRIIQEALNNASKHSQAASVEVIVTFEPQRVAAVIRDDGVGFDVAATEARPDSGRHLGLVSMRERADLDKGSLEIRAQIGKGSEVRATFAY